MMENIDTEDILDPQKVESIEIDDVVSEHVLEIRYKPDSKVLDHRGDLADSISRNLDLSMWRINQNRVDVHNKDGSKRVFVSFRNAGVVIQNPCDSNEFPNIANKFVNHILSQKPFKKKLPLRRIGVRSRFGFSSNIGFADLLSRYLRQFVDVRPEIIDCIGADLIDVGVPLNFEASNGNINTNSGPMEREQLSTFFKFHPKERLPEVSLYIEIDYWIRPEKLTTFQEIASIIRDYSANNWQYAENIRDIVMGD